MLPAYGLLQMSTIISDIEIKHIITEGSLPAGSLTSGQRAEKGICFPCRLSLQDGTCGLWLRTSMYGDAEGMSAANGVLPGVFEVPETSDPPLLTLCLCRGASHCRCLWPDCSLGLSLYLLDAAGILDRDPTACCRSCLA